MRPIQVESEVGADGVLHLCIPVGVSEAKTRVVVRIEPCSRDDNIARVPASSTDELYGSCVDLGLDEPPDLPLPAADV
jgi:hypothetical protein